MAIDERSAGPGDGEGTGRGANRRGLRLRFPVAVILIAAISVFILDRGEWWLRVYMQVLVVLLAVALIGGWIGVSLPRRWPGKMAALLGWIGLLVVLGALAPKVVRVAGARGSGLFELEWVWSEPRGLSELPATATAPPAGGDDPIDALPPEVAAAAYPEFLGSKRDGVLPELDLGSLDWATSPPELLWEREIGLGWSGFTVADGRAVTQEQRGDQEVVSCYELLTGEVLWSHANDARFSESMGGTGPRSNPTIDGGRVFALGATGILNCLDLRTGSLIWSHETIASDQNIDWGKSCAPLVVDDLGLVVVTGGKSPGPALLAYSTTDGTPAWAAGEWAASYSSPVLATVAGHRQIVAVHADRIAGHAVVDGAVLWEHAWPGSYPRVAQPIVVGENRVLATAGYGMGALLIEVTPEVGGAGAGPDRDPDPGGGSDRVRGGEAEGTPSPAFTASEVWRSLRMKTKFSSAVVRDGIAYGLDEGRLAALDLSDGSRAWRGEKLGYGQNLLVGDTILVQAESGDVVLVDASPDGFNEITRFGALGSKTWNPPAVAGNFLLVRNAERAACYRIR